MDIYVRPVEQNGVRLYKFFWQVAPRKYEIIEELTGYFRSSYPENRIAYTFPRSISIL